MRREGGCVMRDEIAKILKTGCPTWPDDFIWVMAGAMERVYKIGYEKGWKAREDLEKSA